MFVSFEKSRAETTSSPLMQMRMTCNWISSRCLRRIAQAAFGRRAVTAEDGKALRVEPTPPDADPTGSEGSAGRCDRCSAAWGFARMFPSIQRDVELICLHRQAFIARIAAAKSSTHIH
jgi:hypothetical protein